MPSPSPLDLARSPLFATLAPADLEEAARLFSLRSYPKDAILVTEGDRLQVFSVVLSGRVKFYWRDDNGRQVDVATVAPYDDFAAQALTGEPLLTSIAAMDDVLLASIPVAEFERLLLRHPALAVAYIKRVVHLFRRTMAGRKSMAMADVYGRLTELLLASAVETDGQRITEPLTQAEIGRRIGATREMVGRVLRELAKGGYIRTGGGRITVLRTPPRHW